MNVVFFPHILQSQIIQDGDDELYVPERVQLSYQFIDSHGAYLLDTSEYIYIFIGKAISDHFVQNVFNVPTFSALPFDSVIMLLVLMINYSFLLFSIHYRI